MQLAYSRLVVAHPERAAAALDQAQARSKSQPFAFDYTKGIEGKQLMRALSLMRLGELKWGRVELEKGARRDSPALLWGMGMLYSQAGAEAEAHQLARGRLTDWLERWPVGTWRRAWEVLFPRPYHDIVTAAAERNSLPESLIYAVMREESGFRASVVSHADAYGLMQLIKPTAKHFAKKEGLPFSTRALKTPSVNIALGAAALRSFQDRFPDNPLLVVPGYNAGPGGPKRWLKERPDVDFDVWVEAIPFRETRRYTKRVLASRGVYRYLYEGASDEGLVLPIRLQVDEG
jgi:soluble lytic murein transglycosylase